MVAQGLRLFGVNVFVLVKAHAGDESCVGFGVLAVGSDDFLDIVELVHQGLRGVGGQDDVDVLGVLLPNHRIFALPFLENV